MILEAFAAYLHAADPKTPATTVLARWLIERLSSPPLNNVDRVLHCEMSMSGSPRVQKASKRKHLQNFQDKPQEMDVSSYVFKGKSDSGKRLLISLYEYCQSYDQQKWSRFVHTLKASDFNKGFGLF